MIWTHSLTRCVASCMLGVAVWMCLRTYYDASLSIDIPVRAHNLLASRVIVQEALRITVTGPWKSLCNYLHQKPVITLEVNTHTQGLHELAITTQQLNLPPDVHLASHPTVLLFVNPSR